MNISVLRILNGFFLLSLLFLCACHYKAEDRSIESLTVLPEQFSELDKQVSRSENSHWWMEFEREDLNALMNSALIDNLDLQQAWARLAQAQAMAIKAGASRIPSVGASLGYDEETTKVGGDSTTSSGSSYEARFSASYELDIWGKIRAQREAAQLDAVAVQEDLEATALVLSSNIAEKWIDLIVLHQGLALLKSQIEANQTSLELIELRFENSQSSALDVFQQRRTVAQVQAQLPSVEASYEISKQELALLLGKMAGTEFSLDYEVMPELKDFSAVGLPMELLKNRPDVRAGFARLQSEDWQLAESKAARLPSMTLSASITDSATNLSDLFEDWVATLAAEMSQSLIDGGSKAMDVARQRAVVEEKLAALKSLILTAHQEVESSLLFERKTKEEVEALRYELDMTRLSYEEAYSRYTNGLTDYLNVVSSLTRYQTLERQILLAQSRLLKARIASHIALGGRILEEEALVNNGLLKQSPLLDILNKE